MTEVVRFRNYVAQIGVSYLGQGLTGQRLVGGYENAERFPNKAAANKAVLRYFMRQCGGMIKEWRVFEEPR